MAEKQSRRYQIRWVKEWELFDLFCQRWCLRHAESIYVHFLDGVPPTASVHHVFHDTRRRCFGFVLEDESFPEVPDGAEPSWAGPLQWETMTIAIDKEGYSNPTVPAYATLVEENHRLRGIFSDYLQDHDRLRLIYEQAKLDARRESMEKPDE